MICTHPFTLLSHSNLHALRLLTLPSFNNLHALYSPYRLTVTSMPYHLSETSMLCTHPTILHQRPCPALTLPSNSNLNALHSPYYHLSVTSMAFPRWKVPRIPISVTPNNSFPRKSQRLLHCYGIPRQNKRKLSDEEREKLNSMKNGEIRKK